MTPNHSPHAPGPQIRGMLTVILSAIACAFLIVFLLVRYYGPTGQYTIEQVLLQPDLLPQLSYQERDPTTGKMSQYTYDHMEYTYFDSASSQWKKQDVSTDRYKEFVRLVAGDRSLLDPQESVLVSFSQKRAAVLTVWVKNNLSTALKTFQEIAFVPDVDLFRVELRQQDNVQPWAYFEHTGIYEDTKRLFDTL